jgi:hypothetical protein
VGGVAVSTTSETVISREDLAKLGEYSTTLPTGTTIGKRWRRNVQVHRRGVPAEWMIGEYVTDPNPAFVGIRWTWAVVEPGVVHRGDPREPQAWAAENLAALKKETTDG